VALFLTTLCAALINAKGVEEVAERALVIGGRQHGN